jgi:6-carboxyhexanoate--CoA ligase
MTMSTSALYSIRMRAASGGQHLSGVERIVPLMLLDETVQSCLERAWTKDRGPDTVAVTVEPLEREMVRELISLDLRDLRVDSICDCRKAALLVLQAVGVSLPAALEAMRLLDRGPSSSGTVMRGAMIMDAQSGKRLERDQDRGLRVSRFDWSAEAYGMIDCELRRIGLLHFRTREALALATKAAHASGMLAELCWSDDGDYTAGYVASRGLGYVRLPKLKQVGSTRGGRAFFVDPSMCDLNAFSVYLQSCPVLIADIGRCIAAADIESVLRGS